MSVPRQEPVAVLGIGAMGHGMATSAMRAGIPPIVWNRTPAATRDLAGLGAEVAASAVDAACRTAIVVTMVTDTDAVISIARDQACWPRFVRVRSGCGWAPSAWPGSGAWRPWWQLSVPT